MKKKQIHLLNKNYSSFENEIHGFIAPCTTFDKIINHVLNIFEKHFEKIKPIKNVC